MWQAITDLIDVVEGSDEEEDQIILLSPDSDDVNVTSTCNITHQSNDHTTAEDNNNERERSYDDYRYYEEDENEEEEGGGILGELNNMLGGVLFGNNDEEDGLGLTLEEIEAARRCELEETFTEPLVVTLEGGGGQTTAEDVGAERIDNTTTYKIENDGRDNDDANDTSHDHDDGDYDDYAQLARDEYLCELNQLSQFLETFKVEEHTQEISELLSTSPANNDDDDGETTTTKASLSPLQIHFQTLVPQTV